MVTVRGGLEAGTSGSLISCGSSIKPSSGYKSRFLGSKIPRTDLSVQNLNIRPLIVSASNTDSNPVTYDDLKAGSPVVIIEPPPYLKTAEPMPMMRANSGLVMSGDAGRVIGRKAKGVWAVRVASGAFLIDEKYFKPLKVN